MLLRHSRPSSTCEPTSRPAPRPRTRSTGLHPSARRIARPLSQLLRTSPRSFAARDGRSTKAAADPERLCRPRASNQAPRYRNAGRHGSHLPAVDRPDGCGAANNDLVTGFVTSVEMTMLDLASKVRSGQSHRPTETLKGRGAAKALRAIVDTTTALRRARCRLTHGRLGSHSVESS